jgi:Rrf2 family protein
MRLAQKTTYALRALLELAKHDRSGPQSISAIGCAQEIPAQFLQVIMRELRQGGFVESKRGKDGGYQLKAKPEDLTMGTVIRFLEGSVAPVDLDGDSDRIHGPFHTVWMEVRDTVDALYDRVTFRELVDRDRDLNRPAVPDYMI